MIALFTFAFNMTKHLLLSDKIIFAAILIWAALIVFLYHRIVIVERELNHEIEKSQKQSNPSNPKDEKSIPVLKNDNFEYLLL